MMKKICFVIMGFGKKTDYINGKTYDLDKTYFNIIKPTIEELDYICVRSDEISHTGYIDKHMYSLLVHADLVIADISTFNPNAMYELGIRHASKPYKTIILAEDSILSGYHPFDINHIAALTYKHLGDDIGYTEVVRIKDRLKEIILKSAAVTDSPLYTFLTNMNVHQLSDIEKEEIVELIAADEVFIAKKTEEAMKLMNNDRFIDAYYIWKELNEKSPNEISYIQKMTISRYKSKHPDERTALEEAKTIISRISLDNNDPETLGISGAISKKIFLLNGDKYVLEQAIEQYEKGYKLNKNYYNGENYATCIELMHEIEENKEEKIHYKVLSRKIREEVLDISRSLEVELEQRGNPDKWLYATLANLFLYFDQSDNYESYSNKFKKLTSIKWEIETFDDGIRHINEFKKRIK